MGVIRLPDGTQEFVTCAEDCLRIVREKLGPDLAVQIEDHVSGLEDKAVLPFEYCDFYDKQQRRADENEQEVGHLRMTLDNINKLLKAAMEPPSDEELYDCVRNIMELLERG